MTDHLFHHLRLSLFVCNTPVSTEIYTLSLHDALPIYGGRYPLSHTKQRARSKRLIPVPPLIDAPPPTPSLGHNFCQGFFGGGDRKSTRLNSSHLGISYAVFCLKKKNKILTSGEYTPTT